MNSSAPKGTSWDEAMSNRKKIKPVSLAIASQSGRQAVSQSVSRKFI